MFGIHNTLESCKTIIAINVTLWVMSNSVTYKPDNFKVVRGRSSGRGSLGSGDPQFSYKNLRKLQAKIDSLY